MKISTKIKLTLIEIDVFMHFEVVDHPAVPEDAKGPLQLPVHRDYRTGYPVPGNQSSRLDISHQLPVQ